MNDVLDVMHRNRIDAGEGLVEQDEARIGRQRAGNFDAPPLAARQTHAQAIADMGDVQFAQ